MPTGNERSKLVRSVTYERDIILDRKLSLEPVLPLQTKRHKSLFCQFSHELFAIGGRWSGNVPLRPEVTICAFHMRSCLGRG
jgi:hypothetical protein